MVARWKQVMREASWDGIKFPVTRISSTGGRTLALHTYPDVPGQEVEDQGRVAEQWNIEAIWSADLAEIWGTNIYPEGWRLFKERMDKGGSATLVLPVWDDVNAALMRYSPFEDATKPDTIRASMTFVEDSLEPFSITKSTSLENETDAELRAGNIDLGLTNAGDSLTTTFEDLLREFRLALYSVQATQNSIQTTYEKVSNTIRNIVDTSTALKDPNNWSIMESIVLFQKDLKELAESFEKNKAQWAVYRVNADTTLFALSVRFYGTNERWEELGSLNASVVQNPLRVKAGTTITYQVA